MKKWLVTLFLVLGLVLAACGGGNGEEGATDDSATEESAGGDTSEESTDEGTSDESGSAGEVNVEAAEQVFQQNCATCHGGDLGGGVGPALTDVGASYSSEEIVEIIQNGKGQMPAQGQVSDDDAQLVANWLATMK